MRRKQQPTYDPELVSHDLGMLFLAAARIMREPCYDDGHKALLHSLESGIECALDHVPDFDGNHGYEHFIETLTNTLTFLRRKQVSHEKFWTEVRNKKQLEFAMEQASRNLTK